MIVVLDTSAIYAIADARDPSHDRANAALDDLEAAEARLHVVNYAASETLSLMSRRMGMRAARAAHSIIARCGLLWTDPFEHGRAVDLFLATGRSLSFVDCATIALMSTRGIDDIFTFDADFARAGLNVIPAT